MVAFVATVKVKDGMADAYEALLRDIARKSEELEPGCISYKPFRHRTEKNTYVVVEHYVDQDAIIAHRNTEHFAEAMARAAPLTDGEPRIVVCDELGG